MPEALQMDEEYTGTLPELDDSSNPAAENLAALEQAALLADDDAEIPSREELLTSLQAVGDIQRRLFAKLTIDSTSMTDMVETEVSHMVRSFQELCALNKQQGARIEQVIDTAQYIRLGEETYTLDQFGKFIDETLNNVINITIIYSKKAMAMVYRLSDVMERLDNIEQLANDVGLINRKTNMLALNTAVEANRSGAEGATFQVIAQEARDLAQRVDIMACDIREEVEHISSGVRDTHKMLVDFAGTDMSPNLVAQERLERLLKALVEQNRRFKEMLQDATLDNKRSSELASLVTSFQFEDRLKQSMSYLTDTFTLFTAFYEQNRAMMDCVNPTSISDRMAMEDKLCDLVNALMDQPTRQQNMQSLIRGEQAKSWGDLVGSNKKSNEEYEGEDIELF